MCDLRIKAGDHGLVSYLRLIVWAILRRPIIHGVDFRGGVVVAPTNHHLLIMGNRFTNLG